MTSAGTEETVEQEDAISIPLYLSGLAVSVLGILAVNSALSDSQFGSTTLVLTLLGFVFSIACRWLRIKLRVVEILGVCVAIYFIYRYLTHSFSLAVFIPPDITESDLIMAVVLEWLTVVRAWVLTSDESVVFTAVTSVAMIGLVGASNINAELLIYFFAYTIFATFMLLHHTYLTQRSWSIFRSFTGSESNVITIQAVLALFSGIAAILMAMVVVIPLRAVGSHLSLANALKNFVGNQRGNDNVAPDADTSVNLSDDPTFRIGTGSGFTASDLVVMRVMPSDHSEHYYRGRTYDTYEGVGWFSSEKGETVPLRSEVASEQTRTAYLLPQGIDAGADQSQPIFDSDVPVEQLSTRFSMASGNTSTLYLPYGTVRVYLPTSAGINVTESPDNNVALNAVVGGAFLYESFSRYTDGTPLELRALPSAINDCPPEIRRQYVDQKGDDVVSLEDRERLNITARGIIQSLPRNRRTEFDIAEAIRSWVSHRAVYSLSVEPVPSGEDAVSYFLYDSRKGYCDLFASSMAVLCRYAGIPSRVATGFDSGVQNERGGYDLRERDKHAWVEVWFPKYGWHIFDPTEGSLEDTSVTESKFSFSWLTKALGAIRLFFYIHGFPTIVIGTAIAGGLLYVLKIEVLDKMKGGVAATLHSRYASLEAAKRDSPLAAAVYSKNVVQYRYLNFEKILERAGLKRGVAQTPSEFLVSVRESLRTIDSTLVPNVEELDEAATQLTDDVMLASYAPMDLVGDELISREESGVGSAALTVVQMSARNIRLSLRQAKKEMAPR